MNKKTKINSGVKRAEKTAKRKQKKIGFVKLEEGSFDLLMKKAKAKAKHSAPIYEVPTIEHDEEQIKQAKSFLASLFDQFKILVVIDNLVKNKMCIIPEWDIDLVNIFDTIKSTNEWIKVIPLTEDDTEYAKQLFIVSRNLQDISEVILKYVEKANVINKEIDGFFQTLISALPEEMRSENANENMAKVADFYCHQFINEQKQKATTV